MSRTVRAARFNTTNGGHFYVPVETVNYILKVEHEEFTDTDIAWRLWKKADWSRPHLHESFDRHSLRAFLRYATGDDDSQHILHHFHVHRNLADVDAICSLVYSIKRAVENHAYSVVTIRVNY
jgi:hypothetical protein